MASQPEIVRRRDTSDRLEVQARIHRRTALVELRGELDITTAPKVAAIMDELKPDAAVVRHVVLDLRGLTFMDSTGLHELIRQDEFARQNRHNLAVVRGRRAIQKLLKLTALDERLILVDDPEDLVPPPTTPEPWQQPKQLKVIRA